jgi:S-adenosylmethionine hydrolase
MKACRGIWLFTDFGPWDHYLGEMKAVISTALPQLPVMDLMPCAPRCNPRASAYLLGAILETLPKDLLVIGVVDPGVGGERQILMVSTGRHWLLGPDNGLLALAARLPDVQVEVMDWRPSCLSRSFHGRDLFAPAAARWLKSEPLPRHAISYEAMMGADWPSDLAEVIHVDHYGNLISGLRLSADATGKIRCGGESIPLAGTFCDVPAGGLFGYRNSAGLLEIAVNQGSAAERLDVRIGESLTWQSSS